MIPLTSIIGYSIKPTAIFVLLAILFVEVCLLITNRKEIIKKYSKVNLVKAMICILVALLGFGFASVASGKISNYGVQIDKDRSFTATHFLMMGINLENHGG
ncbi:MAG: hypothetical protein Q4F54_05925 [Coriobacteriia bacterium]|nr:hypothetical protein [Coriobacteriia bacterium]